MTVLLSVAGVSVNHPLRENGEWKQRCPPCGEQLVFSLPAWSFLAFPVCLPGCTWAVRTSRKALPAATRTAPATVRSLPVCRAPRSTSRGIPQPTVRRILPTTAAGATHARFSVRSRRTSRYCPFSTPTGHSSWPKHLPPAKESFPSLPHTGSLPAALLRGPSEFLIKSPETPFLRNLRPGSYALASAVRRSEQLHD